MKLDGWPWKIIGHPILCCFQVCAWFHCHMWIQTGVRVRKRLSWVLTFVTLTFDLWPWPFAWTSLLTMVITPENFMKIPWWEHGEKGVTDGQTDRRTDWTSHIAAWSQLKTLELYMNICVYIYDSYIIIHIVTSNTIIHYNHNCSLHYFICAILHHLQITDKSCTLVGNKIVEHSDVSWSIANRLHKDKYKMRREKFKFWYLVPLISEVWWYIQNCSLH